MTRRAAALALAAAGLAASGDLAAYQLELVAKVWDPLFGPASSARVLHSALSRALPVPDALLGALAYAAELAAGLVAWRWPRRPVLLAYGAIAALLALSSVGLVAIQALVVRHFCLLCLASAAISWAVAALVVPESLAAMNNRTLEEVHAR
jgi:uncharacterized membrane protein